jgi:hypothetical protein
MKHFLSRLCVGLFATAVLAESGFPQKPLTWQEVRERFEAANPTLRAGQQQIKRKGDTSNEVRKRTFLKRFDTQPASP